MTNNELRAWCEAEIEKCTKYGFSPEHEGKALALREVLTRIETNSRTGDAELIADLRRMAKGQREGLHYEGSSVSEGFKFTAERAADRIESITPPEVGGELIERVAKAICRAWYYCDLDKPDGINHWNANTARCTKEAEAAIAILSTPEVVDGTAGRSVSEYSYTELFNAIAAATSVYAGGAGVNISVTAFRAALSQHRGVS